ncbi:MAG: acetyl-CoA acetyltransferase, partial [Chloroflexi bacterium]|nr:acetyl-CoA acetyltransferase [Chloroflexota bacterium]
MTDWPMRDKTAIVGIGETEYTRWGQITRSEFQLACEAVLKAIEDAGLTVKDIDGICSYSNDRNEPTMIATALGIPQLTWFGAAVVVV